MKKEPFGYRDTQYGYLLKYVNDKKILVKLNQYLECLVAKTLFKYKNFIKN